MGRKMNFLWVFFGMSVLAALFVMSQDEYKIPYSKLNIDSVTTVKTAYLESGGNGPDLANYEPGTYIEPLTETFLGKSFSKCMQSVYDWPDGKIFDVNDGHDGTETINFMVNGNHHELFFHNGICVVDNVNSK